MNCTNLFLGLLLACEMGRVNVLISNNSRIVRIRLGGEVMVIGFRLVELFVEMIVFCIVRVWVWGVLVYMHIYRYEYIYIYAFIFVCVIVCHTRYPGWRSIP